MRASKLPELPSFLRSLFAEFSLWYACLRTSLPCPVAKKYLAAETVVAGATVPGTSGSWFDDICGALVLRWHSREPPGSESVVRPQDKGARDVGVRLTPRPDGRCVG